MKKDILEIASILDDGIVKAHSRARRKMRKIRKGLSFNPMAPHEMSADSPYYCPYLQLQDGSFAPYPEEVWNQDPTNTNYRTVQQFYSVVGENFRPGPAVREFRIFKKSVPSKVKVVKASTGRQSDLHHEVAIGTIHTYKDGRKYRKVSAGVWVPEKLETQHSLMHHDDKKRKAAHGELERHAQHTRKIESVLKQKKDRAKMIEEAKKEVLRHIRGSIGKLFDGPMPDGLKQDYDLRRKLQKKGKK